MTGGNNGPYLTVDGERVFTLDQFIEAKDEHYTLGYIAGQNAGRPFRRLLWSLIAFLLGVLAGIGYFGGCGAI